MGVRKHRCQTSTGGWRAYIPHTPTLAYLIPNQHTLTCRYINDLVSKKPAYPQTGDVLRNQPFLSPIEQAYLELCYTTRCEAEALFHNPFIIKVHLLSPQHIRTKGRQGSNIPFGAWSTQGPTPAALHTVLQPGPFSFPSCGRKGTSYACILTVFARGVTKRVHQCKFWLGLHCTKIFKCGLCAKHVTHVHSSLWHMVLYCMCHLGGGQWCTVEFIWSFNAS